MKNNRSCFWPYEDWCPEEKVNVLKQKSINTHFLSSTQALNWNVRNAKVQIHDEYEPHDKWGAHTDTLK